MLVTKSFSHVRLCASPWIVAHQTHLSFTLSQSLFKFMSIELVMLSNHLILCPTFFSCPRSFPASGSFPMSQLFTSGGQSIGVSASASVLPMNTQDWSPLGLTSVISLQSKGLSRVFSSTTVRKHKFLGSQPSLWSDSHICTWLQEKPYLWLYGPLPAKWCLCFLIRCLGIAWSVKASRVLKKGESNDSNNRVLNPLLLKWTTILCFPQRGRTPN